MKNYNVCLVVSGFIGIMALTVWIIGCIKTIFSSQPMSEWVVDVTGIIPLIVIFVGSGIILYLIQRGYDTKAELIQKEYEVYMKTGKTFEGKQ